MIALFFASVVVFVILFWFGARVHEETLLAYKQAKSQSNATIKSVPADKRRSRYPLGDDGPGMVVQCLAFRSLGKGKRKRRYP